MIYRRDKGDIKDPIKFHLSNTMSCLHRFHTELLPRSGMKYLFIGTFNPIWKVKKGEDPDYFYSRPASLFWCILPHALNDNCIVDKDRNVKEEFCRRHKIGLTDLIYCINNVDETNKEHKKFLTSGFKDEDFSKVETETFELNISFYTPEIKRYINANLKSLKGVFFTRKSKDGIEKIWNEWLTIKRHCDHLKITAVELSSPSPRGGAIRNKIFEWRTIVNNASCK